MATSKKASTRVTAADRERAAASRSAKRQTRRTAIAAKAAQQMAGRQFDKTAARAIQGHIQVRTKRKQAKRDSV